MSGSHSGGTGCSPCRILQWSVLRPCMLYPLPALNNWRPSPSLLNRATRRPPLLHLLSNNNTALHSSLPYLSPFPRLLSPHTAVSAPIATSSAKVSVRDEPSDGEFESAQHCQINHLREVLFRQPAARHSEPSLLAPSSSLPKRRPAKTPARFTGRVLAPVPVVSVDTPGSGVGQLATNPRPTISSSLPRPREQSVR